MERKGRRWESKRVGSGRIKGNNLYYATMLNTMCFAIKKGVLTEETKIKREEARDARYGRQEVWTPPPPLPPPSQKIILQSTNLLPKQSI